MLRAQRGGHLSAWALAVFLITTDLAAGAPAKAPNPEVGGCTPIRTAAQLQAIKNDLAGNYCLMRDIDAGSIANFTPIGTVGNPFVGRFDGNGHVIRNLTIANSNPAVQYVGLFGDVGDAIIQDVGLVNADVSSEIAGYVGALIGVLFTPPGGVAPTVRRVFATGKVGCSGSPCTAGGLMGYASNSNIFDVWSSAAVRSSNAGGLVGQFNGNTLVRNSYATGDVTCENACNWIGGFSTQLNSGDLVRESFATGNVQCPTCLTAGGFVGVLQSGATMIDVYATGAVVSGGQAGGLIGASAGTAVSCFAAGPVQSPFAGGLIGEVGGAPTVTDCYWDSSTTGQTTSAGGLGTARTTAQLRANLPAGFRRAAWGINGALSYPFLNTNGFSSNLATLVRAAKIYTALPIKQSDKSQYLGNPRHTNVASLATVYTMVARAIGQTLGVPSLDNAKIDRFFWRDATRRTLFRGPVTAHATIGPMRPIRASTPLNTANVIGRFNARTWVVLRGTYRKPNGRRGTHYMLGTLYTRTGAKVEAVIANDPFTGEQVAIDPVTKRVVQPRGFPLAGFKVNGYATISNIH